MKTLAHVTADPHDPPTQRRSPYQGLAPYGVADAAYFFARDTSRETIVDYLRAYRISILYGASGVGKSSVLRAGVVHELQQVGRASFERDDTLEVVPVIFSTWSGDPAAGLQLAIRSSVEMLAPALSEDPPSGTLTELISAWGDRLGATLLIILDQFEEYFVYHPRDEGPSGFASQLATAVGQHEVPAHLLIAIREDAIAKLDRFQHAVPELWTNLLRMDHLDHGAAREAIVKPIERWSEETRTAIGLEDGVVSAVLDQAQTRSVRVDKTGLGALDEDAQDEGAEDRVEAPYLQLVMTRLWDEERRHGSHVLRAETLTRMGGADEIIRKHFDEVMRALPRRRRIVAARLFEYLVTPAGTKIALPPSVIARWSHQKESQVTAVLEELAKGEHRILRTAAAPGDPEGATAYEIYHDRLGAGILDWRARFARRRTRRRVVGIALLMLAAVVVVAGLVIGRQANRYDALQQRLDEQQRLFKKTQGMVRTNAQHARLFAAMAPMSDEGDHTAFFSPDGRLLITASDDGNAVVSRADSGRRVRTIRAGAPVARAIFSPDSRLIGVETASAWGGVWGARRRLLRTDASSNFDSLAFTPDGKSVLTARDDGTARLRDVRSGRTSRVFHGGRDALDTAVLNPQGTLLATVAGARAVIWQVHSQRQWRSIRVPKGPIAVAFSPRNNDFVTVSPRRAFLWRAGPEPVVLAGAPSHVGPLDQSVDQLETLQGAVAFSRDGQRFAIAADRGARVFDAHGRVVSVLRGHVGAINAVRFSPDGRLVATASDDTTARVWDARSGRSLAVLAAHQSAVTWIDFRRDGRRVVTASADGTAILWNVPPPLPDLTVSAVALRSTRRIAVIGLIVRNTGTSRAPASTLRVEQSVGGGRLLVPSLLPGAAATLIVHVESGARRLVRISIDPDDAIKELDEKNNSAVTSSRTEVTTEKLPSSSG